MLTDYSQAPRWQSHIISYLSRFLDQKLILENTRYAHIGPSLHLILDVEVTEQSLDRWHQKGLQRAKEYELWVWLKTPSSIHTKKSSINCHPATSPHKKKINLQNPMAPAQFEQLEPAGVRLELKVTNTCWCLTAWARPREEKNSRYEFKIRNREVQQKPKWHKSGTVESVDGLCSTLTLIPRPKSLVRTRAV